MLAIIGASGKIGGATLSALLSHNLMPPNQITALTSSQPGTQKWNELSGKGIQVRYASFDDPPSMSKALQNMEKVFLVSSPRIQLDFHDAAEGQGRERDHFVVLEAARKAGVKHVYYTSLAFSNPSRSNVMTAHMRTEKRLREMEGRGVFDVTVLRQGLYNESWPLYLGYFRPRDETRSEVVLADAGDMKISWTAISDLGLANATIVAEPGSLWAGRTTYLSANTDPCTMAEICDIVSKASGRNIELKSVSREEHERHYIRERGMDEGAVKWWSASYDAIREGECHIYDDTLETLLKKAGVEPKTVKETIKEMMGSE